MTPAQLATLRTNIQANTNPAVIQARDFTGDHGVIADYYNGLENAGTERVWKPVVSIVELNNAVVWADFGGRSLQLQGIYTAMIVAGFINMTDQQVRDGLVACFGAASASVTALTAVSRRDSTRLERLFAGSATQGARVTTMFDVQCTPSDVAQALGVV